MSTLYADRGFVSVNGVEVLDVENVSLKRAFGTKIVPTMTRNRRSKGTVKGNLDVAISFSIAVQNRLGSPKLESIDYEQNNVACTFEFGGDRYTATGLDLVDVDESASGVGSEVKKTFNFVATDVLDQVGNSALFGLEL